MVTDPNILGFPTTDSSSSKLSIFDEIERAYATGASDIEICRIMKVRPVAFEERYRKDSYFRELIDMGRMLRRAWWMEQGRVNMTNPKFNRNTWLDYMKNEFGWSEKIETVTDVREKTVEELITEVGPAMKRLVELSLVPTVTVEEDKVEDGNA